jgi:ribonuclease T1
MMRTTMMLETLPLRQRVASWYSLEINKYNAARGARLFIGWCLVLIAASSALAFEPPQTSQSNTIALAELPDQGQQTYQLIFSGGPFEHEKDGAIFGNYERQLPRQSRGYYREYTVDTPGARDRGARRIVCGGFVRTSPKACYYTSNHYSSFRKIVK